MRVKTLVFSLLMGWLLPALAGNWYAIAYNSAGDWGVARGQATKAAATKLAKELCTQASKGRSKCHVLDAKEKAGYLALAVSPGHIAYALANTEDAARRQALADCASITPANERCNIELAKPTGDIDRLARYDRRMPAQPRCHMETRRETRPVLRSQQQCDYQMNGQFTCRDVPTTIWESEDKSVQVCN